MKMEKKNEITVRDVIKKNSSKVNIPSVKISFGCGNIDFHLGISDGKILCYAFGIGKEALKSILDAKVQRVRFDYGMNVLGEFSISSLNIDLEREESGGVEI